MSITPDELDALAAVAFAVHGRIETARRAVENGRTEEALSALADARERNWRLKRTMEHAGGKEPVPPRVAALLAMQESLQPANPLRDLAALDSPANRRLLDALTVAQAAALEVDKERGHAGDGFAEVLEDFAAEVQTEIHGPRGGGWE
jgi:nucleotide-binding universal stress UspA family protein